MSNKIHFAHANGIPAGTYSKLFDNLSELGFEVEAIPMLGHHPDYPINLGWESTKREIADYIRANFDEPIIGIGHSFGATTTYMAACEFPELFEQIILLDPVLLTGRYALGSKLLRLFGLMDYVTPAGRSKDRKTIWNSRAEALSYFEPKKLFKNLEKECLKDYVKFGLKETGKGYTLGFKLENELAVFRKVPLNIDRLKGKLKIKASIITGSETNVVKPYFLKRILKQNSFNHFEIKGSHMFPLEYTSTTANTINQILNNF